MILKTMVLIGLTVRSAPPTRAPDGRSQREVTHSPHNTLLIASKIVDEGRGSSRTQLRSLLG
jgi:hypothetical protein